MQWLNLVVDKVLSAHPEGEIIVSSGVTPSGTYHVGTLREVLTADAVMLELRRRGRKSRHIHVVDDLDVFRKVPVNVPPEFKKYLGWPLTDVPAPDGSSKSYADFFLDDFLKAAKALNLDMEVVRSRPKYSEGFMAPAIEKALEKIAEIRQILETISGHKLDDNWSPVQVIEEGYLKNRRFVSIDKAKNTIVYEDLGGKEQEINYRSGQVKLNWRIDWPARWWLLGVDVEPFGRDHASAGGSYDTGAEIAKKVYGTDPPLPIPYHFINRVGETKKMSKSTGDIIASSDFAKVLPPEIIRYFILRLPPERQLFFDEVGVTKLIDDYAAETDQQLLEICSSSLDTTISHVPFSHLVASYQAALKNTDKTLEIIKRTEYRDTVVEQDQLIREELKFIDQWLKRWAPDAVKFELAEKIDEKQFAADEKQFLNQLADKAAAAPADADGEWFHKAIYELKESGNLSSEQVFKPLYKALISKDQGPRAGWFLSILPRDFLIKRLRLES
ncbi:MAG: lysine--tRNA ligase [Candidatus Saccharimonadales bacterium]